MSRLDYISGELDNAQAKHDKTIKELSQDKINIGPIKDGVVDIEFDLNPIYVHPVPAVEVIRQYGEKLRLQYRQRQRQYQDNELLLWRIRNKNGSLVTQAQYEIVREVLAGRSFLPDTMVLSRE